MGNKKLVARAPIGLRAHRFEVDGAEFAVLSFAHGSTELPGTLTPSERDVCRLLLRGSSNAEIASERGVSKRTVANQVASILKKLGARSRADVVRRLSALRGP